MRLPNLALAFSVSALSLLSSGLAMAQQQPSEMQAGSTDSAKSSSLDAARASGFDFGRVSDLTRAEIKSATPAFNRSNLLSLEPKRVLRATPSNQDLCYSLRVYNFKREGTEAPRMTGSTTCAPASRAIPKSVDGSEPAPKVRYVPQ